MKLPRNLEGVYAKDAGVVKARTGIDTVKELSLKMGAELKYNKNVIAVDHEKGIVELESGEKIFAKHIVVTCGALSD